IGDAVLFSAMLRPIRDRFPGAKIDVLIRKPAQEIIKYNKNLDGIITYNAENASNIITQEFAPLKIARMLRRRNYDLVVTSEHAFRFILLSYLTGAKIRLGYDFEGRGFPLTVKVPYPEYPKRDRLELEYYLDLVRALGINVRPKREWMEIKTSRTEEAFARKFLAENGIAKNSLLVGIHAGGGIWKKRWPIYKYAKLADELALRYGAKIILLGGTEDAALYGQMLRIVGARAQSKRLGNIVSAAGKASIRETAAIVSKCDLVVCNDSAISHIASAQGVRAIALFGVDSPKRWGPFGGISIMKHSRLPECSLLCNYDYLYAVDKCFDDKAPYCLNLISVEDVMEKVASLALRKTKRIRRN
ncbi:MAG: glycosyltransferase family 9 protein, partial [Candidatus Micrarchaeota archaeon]